MDETSVADRLKALNPGNPQYAPEVVDALLAAAVAAGASDVHVQPIENGLDVRWRVDGVLQAVATLPRQGAPNVVARLKVLAELLTYRTDVPQEGRIRRLPGRVEMRLSTFPTLHGEKAVVRIFAGPGRFLGLADLGLPDEIRDNLSRLLDETSGAIVLAGPAGSGKTTTIYACLREIARRSEGRRSLATLEDPIESAIDGVSQSQVDAAAGLTLDVGLRALLRQDPEVLAVGEIRDRATAETTLQAALTGHLTLTTFHAGSACEVVGRLLDMGIEPYAIRSGLRAVVALRLARRLCAECSKPIGDRAEFLGLPVRSARAPVGCAACKGTGYSGRLVLAEMLPPLDDDLGRAVLERADVRRMEELAVAAGMTTRWVRAREAVEQGSTSPAEVRRVLGMGGDLPIPD
ncbi:GspE/PulE family protein [Paludisphaera rhizosphaerae]|uniref:GspE/PulE family protein n=1 Tax=Paludisphaera rhizosphaerae TaxID=2711216 RepID=UPI0013EA6BEC|nr:GspE/PulE family protein [Paludisphaera rhizosphaerae]